MYFWAFNDPPRILGCYCAFVGLNADGTLGHKVLRLLRSGTSYEENCLL